MQIKKVALEIFVTVLTLFTVSIPAFAVTPHIDSVNIMESTVATPRWANIAVLNPYLKSSGTTLYPDVQITAKSDSAGITGTMYLQEYSGGRWINVADWDIGDVGSTFVSGEYEGESGYKYRTKVVVTVNGERGTVYSATCSI